MSRAFATDIAAHRYPGIARAALEMAYDNGGVTRDRPEGAIIQELGVVLAEGFDLAFDLNAISGWLLSLPDTQLNIAVAGEYSEMVELMSGAPPGTNSLLNAIFDGRTPPAGKAVAR